MSACLVGMRSLVCAPAHKMVQLTHYEAARITFSLAIIQILIPGDFHRSRAGEYSSEDVKVEKDAQKSGSKT